MKKPEAVLFEEVQGFTKKPVRRFAGVISLLFAAALIVSLLRGQSTNEGIGEFYISGLLLSVVAWLLMQIKMVTQVREDGIYVRMSVLQSSFVVYRWAEINKLYIREYNALQEFWGWGIRYNASGKAYTLSGSTGLQLELNNGRKVLIGTRCPQQLEAVLQQVQQ